MSQAPCFSATSGGGGGYICYLVTVIIKEQFFMKDLEFLQCRQFGGGGGLFVGNTPLLATKYAMQYNLESKEWDSESYIRERMLVDILRHKDKWDNCLARRNQRTVSC